MHPLASKSYGITYQTLISTGVISLYQYMYNIKGHTTNLTGVHHPLYLGIIFRGTPLNQYHVFKHAQHSVNMIEGHTI